jgi:hypothetical protein
MSNLAAVEKDSDNERQIPSVWRSTLSKIVDAFKNGDFQLMGVIPNVPALTESKAITIKRNVESYGAILVSLPEESWNTSVCQWMAGYWDVLIDLFTESEGASDLVLSVRVRESSIGYVFDVMSVHVP